MKRKKIKATKKNKEIIRNYKKVKSILNFCGDVNVKITCSKCREIIAIRTHKPELYTEEVRKKYICLNCNYPSNRAIVFQKDNVIIKAQVSSRVQNLFEEWGFKRRQQNDTR